MSTIPKRKIGDAEVSCIGYGAMGMSAFHGEITQSDEERFKVRISTTISVLTNLA